MQVPLIAALLVFWSLGQASPTDSPRSIAHHRRYYDHRSTKSNKTYGLSELIHMRAPAKKREKRGLLHTVGDTLANAGMGKILMKDKKISSAQNAILKEREFQLKEKKLQMICHIAIVAIVAVVGCVLVIGGGLYFLTKNNDPKPIFGPNRGSTVSSSSPPPPPVNFQQTLFQMISDKFDLLFVLFILITSTVVLCCVVRLRTLVAKRILVIGSRRNGVGGGAGISRIYSQSPPSTARSYYSNQTKKSSFSRVPPTSVNCPPSNFSRLK